MDKLRTKRVYEEPTPADGHRVLVDRLWPRGVRKADADLDAWAKELAPSDELRTWFDHDPERWDEFRRRYAEELGGKGGPIEEHVLDREGTVTLLYAARDTAHNNAVALREYVERLIEG